MFDEKTILTRLQNGEDAQTIANEMAAMINAANKMYNDQKAAEEAKAKERDIQKRNDLQEILNQLINWLGTYYDLDMESIKHEVTAEALIGLINSLDEYMNAMKDLQNLLGVKPKAPAGTKVIKSNTPPKSADDTLNDFLKQMGW